MFGAELRAKGPESRAGAQATEGKVSRWTCWPLGSPAETHPIPEDTGLPDTAESCACRQSHSLALAGWKVLISRCLTQAAPMLVTRWSGA